MDNENKVAYSISAQPVRRGLTTIAVITITDGVDKWTFDSSETFTVKELKERFPFFNKKQV